MAELFGPYRLDELIGRGGMGEVYRAYDTVKERTVALKRLPAPLASDEQYRLRFRSESALAARLSEPHIIPIHDFGEIDGRLFIDMRLVDGTDVGTVVATRGPMEPRRAVHVVAQVAGALDAAHAARLIHRDVKPSNVIVRGEGEDEFAYLIDFGIARAVTTGGGSITGSGGTVGTMGYMAPERFGSGRIDGRVDVYSLACLLFELLTGTAPFRAPDPAGVIQAHLALDPPRPSHRRPGVPVALDAVVARGMAKDPDARFATARALAGAAREALAVPAPHQTVVMVGQATAPPPPATRRSTRPDTNLARGASPVPPASPRAHRPARVGAPLPRLMIGSAVLQVLLAVPVLIGSAGSLLFRGAQLGAGDVRGYQLAALASLAYLACTAVAVNGRGWATVLLAVANIGLGLSVLFGTGYASTWPVILAPLGYLAAATIPMFTPAANRYFARPRRPAGP